MIHIIPTFYIYLVPVIIKVGDTKFLGISFNLGGGGVYSGLPLDVGLRYEVQ